jgi:chromosome segregation ATPase
MFRRLRTRRAIKAAEKSSGLKQENSIFRGKKMASLSPHPQSGTIPTLTATFSSSEASETDGATSTINYDISQIQHMNNNVPYDVDVTMNGSPRDSNTTTELFNTGNQSDASREIQGMQEQMKLMVQELENDHNEAIHEKNVMMHNLSQELDRTRQDFIDVIVDLNVREQELSATKQALAQKEIELENVTKDLFTVKEQLNVHGAKLIQYQHKVHVVEEELNARKLPFGFLYL